ncbi:hypothetical protein EMIT0158MI4_120071 [Burkholderia ambifaria]
MIGARVARLVHRLGGVHRAADRAGRKPLAGPRPGMPRSHPQRLEPCVCTSPQSSPTRTTTSSPHDANCST